MRTIPAKEAKNNFGYLIDQARHEAVAISRHGRDVVVILAIEDYNKMISQTIWNNFQNIEHTFPVEKIIAEHRKAGVPMYFKDQDTPEGKLVCLSPDGTKYLIDETTKIVPSEKEV